MFADRSFSMSATNYSESLNWLAEILSEENLPANKIFEAKLLFEESILHLKKFCTDESKFAAQLSIRKRFGDTQLVIETAVETPNPLTEFNQISDEDESFYNIAILKAYKDRIQYSVWNGKTTVAIRIHVSPHKTTRRTLFALIFGTILGLLLKNYVAPQVLDWIEYNILDSAQTIFMNALMMLVAPMIFLSIVSGITDISDATYIKRVGWRIILISILKLTFYTAMGLLFGYFVGGMPELLSKLTITDSTAILDAKDGFSIRNLIVKVMPDNIISPFLNNDVMQILFLACFCGVMMSRMGERAAWARQGISLLNRLVSDMTEIISRYIPLLVLVSTMNLVIHTGLEGIFSYIGIIIATAIGLPLCLLCSAVIFMFIGRLSPLPFLKKTSRFIALPFSLSSSTACMPATINFCSKKLGIDERVSMFSIPVGMQFNMDGTGFYVAIVSMVLVQTFGINIDLNFMISFLIAQVFMAISGIGLLITPSLFASIGIPEVVVTYFIGIEPIMDMFGTAQSVVGNITSTFVVSRLEDRVDETVYRE